MRNRTTLTILSHRVQRTDLLALCAIAALLASASHALADIATLVGTYNSQHAQIDVTFDEVTDFNAGWDFQVFIHADDDIQTGYGTGYDFIVRGVDIQPTPAVLLHDVNGGSSAGGWGPAITNVSFTVISSTQVLIVFDWVDLGLPTGKFWYRFETYFDDRMNDTIGAQKTTQAMIIDCNNNGQDDLLDLQGGSSLDCNQNGQPDECDIAAGTSPDCNGNNTPDECDVASLTSLDCAGNGIPDECEPDCNGSGKPDICDILDGTSQDCDLDSNPDECQPLFIAEGSRYLAVHPQAGPAPVAFLVTGDANNSSVSCLSRFVQADGSLGGQPVFLTPTQWCTAHVTGQEILPATTYFLQTYDGTDFSSAMAATTWVWADVDQNNVANGNDVLYIVLAFLRNPKASLYASDLEPCSPNRVANGNDVARAVHAFLREPFDSLNCASLCP